MDERIENWLDATQAMLKSQLESQDECDKLEDIAHEAPLPKNLIPAEAKHIVEGAIIWYKNFDNGSGWMIVYEVLSPNDNWKAYVAHDGCRYGLEDAFVEVEYPEFDKEECEKAVTDG